MPACNFATEQSNSLSQGWLVEKALDLANGRESNIEYGAKLGAPLTMDIWPRSDRSAQGNRKELRPLRPLLSSHTTGKLNDRKILSRNICPIFLSQNLPVDSHSCPERGRTSAQSIGARPMLGTTEGPCLARTEGSPRPTKAKVVAHSRGCICEPAKPCFGALSIETRFQPGVKISMLSYHDFRE